LAKCCRTAFTERLAPFHTFTIAGCRTALTERLAPCPAFTIAAESQGTNENYRQRPGQTSQMRLEPGPTHCVLWSETKTQTGLEVAAESGNSVRQAEEKTHTVYSVSFGIDLLQGLHTDLASLHMTHQRLSLQAFLSARAARQDLGSHTHAHTGSTRVRHAP